MRTNRSIRDAVRAERIPARRLSDLARRAWRRLPVAALILLVVGGALSAAIPLVPGQYWSNAVLMIAARDAADGHPPPADAPSASAIVDREVQALNSPAMTQRIATEFRRRTPDQAAAIAASAGPKDVGQLLNVRRRGESYLVDVSARGPTPRAAQAVVEAAIEAYQYGQLDMRLAASEADRPAAPPAGNGPAPADPHAVLAQLEAERAALAASAAAPASPEPAQAQAQVELAQARGDIAAVKELLRSEVQEKDIARFRASGAADRLGTDGESFVKELTAYEGALGQPDAKPDDLKFRKYQILTLASVLQPTLEAKASKLAASVGAAPSPAAVAPALAEQLKALDLKIEQQRGIAKTYKPATAAAAARPAEPPSIDLRVVSSPSLGATSTLRQPWALALGAFAVGLLVALVYLLIATLVSNTVIDVRDAAALAGAPVIASAPAISGAQLRSLPPGERHPANFAIEAPASPFADAMRAALASLDLPETRGAGLCLAVTGVQKDDGATTVSLALARSAASAGYRVLLIDADFDQAGLTHAMGIEPAAGIEAILGGEKPLEQLVVEDDVTALHLLPSAPNPASRGALSLAQLTALKAALAGAKASYDLVIIDCEPPSAKSRTRSMSRMADAGLVVVARNSSRRDLLRMMSRRVEQNGARLLGVVFNFSASPAGRAALASERFEAGHAPAFASQPFGASEPRSIH